MDIWRWVYQVEEELRKNGQGRLADLMDDISSLVVDEEHEKVDALIPEALSLARNHPNKWIELYFRHWHLQSLVLNRCEVKEALPEAISLLDFAHQEDTKDCPQSICAVQDLASCYDDQDGLGFAAERIEVASEALEKINASWPCYTCIGAEYVSALIDQGKFEDALGFIADARQQLVEHNESNSLSDFCFSEVSALVGLKRLDEALEITDRMHNEGGGEHFINRKRGYQAYVRALMGRCEESLKYLNSFGTVFRTVSLASTWAETILLLANQEAIKNDWRLQQKVSDLANKLLDQGCYRMAFEHFTIKAELAILRKQKASAQNALAEMESVITHLAKDCGASEKISEIRLLTSTLEENITVDFSLGPDQLELLDENPVERIVQIKKGLKLWPSNEPLILALAESYHAANQSENRQEILISFLESNPNSPAVILEYGYYGNNYNRLKALLERDIDNECKANIHWGLTDFAEKEGSFNLALEHLDALFESFPNAINALHRAIELAIKLEKYDKALVYNQKLLELEPDESNHTWDTILIATLMKDWKLVRLSAQALDMSLSEGEGEIKEDWGNVRIKFDNEILRAKRTGPVTAKITEINSLDDPCLVGNTIIFEPTPLNKLELQDEDGNYHDHEGYYSKLYNALKTLSKANYRTIAIDGVMPNDQQKQEFIKQLTEKGIIYDQRSGQGYELTCNDTSHLGLYAFLYVDDSISDNILHNLLKHACKQLPHPIIWPALAKRVDKTAHCEMLEIAEKFDIDID